jgi:hypothetical protein
LFKVTKKNSNAKIVMIEKPVDKRIVVTVLFFCLSGIALGGAAGVLLYSSQSPKPVNPLLIFTPGTVGFGSVSQGIERGNAVVTNNSPKQIDIKAVTKGCDCTEVRIERGMLLPSEQREISFQWDTHGRRGKNEIVIGVIYTVEGDLVERVAPLIINATIIPDFEVTPVKLEFFSNQKESYQLFLTSVKNDHIQIKDMIVNHPAFSSVVSSDAKSVTINFDPQLWIDGIRYMNAQLITTSENEPCLYVTHQYK